MTMPAPLLDWSQIGSWLLHMAVILVLMFWAVGAYNRVVRLRQTMLAAWAQVEDLLGRRAAALRELITLARDALSEEGASLDALSAALERERQAAPAAKTGHLGVRLSIWLTAEQELNSPLARVTSLVEQNEDLRQTPAVAAALAQLAEMGPRLTYARQGYNDAADVYNAARSEFPTRILTRLLFGFRRVGRV
jgi:LemA protein